MSAILRIQHPDIQGQPKTTLTALESAADTSLAVVNSTGFTSDKYILIGGYNFSITASIGIAIFPEDGDAHEELIKNADIAMFFMQKMGRNGFRFYSAVTT